MKFLGRILLLLTLALIGCGPSSDKVQVTGTVTWEGKPLSTGEIAFFLDDQSLAGAAPIKDGQFVILAKPGKSRVVILAHRSASKPKSLQDMTIQEQYLPSRYNLNSELTAEVVAPGPITTSFHLIPD